MKNLLVQLQLSNYDSSGKFILECDSGAQMMFGRIRVLLNLDKNLKIYVLGPHVEQCLTAPDKVYQDLFNMFSGRLFYLSTNIAANALATRYDFSFDNIVDDIKIKTIKYDTVYINDPMLLRHYRALFFLKAGYMPHFVVHSHFIDDPDCPKFPTEASLWFGQMEAAYKADYNFWQCQSSLDVFLKSAASWLQEDIVKKIEKKSSSWDDGYSSEEINSTIDTDNIRFNTDLMSELIKQKIVLFVPNRVGGLGRSSDYTNCGHFLFNVFPEIVKQRKDVFVVAGNPSQKILNSEIAQRCSNYVNLVSGTFNRDEYKWLGKNCQIAVGLYNQDTYGGTASRELLDLGCLPLWVDNYEYSSIAREVGWPVDLLIKPDLSDIVDVTNKVISLVSLLDQEELRRWRNKFKNVVRQRCSYEATTPAALVNMK